MTVRKPSKSNWGNGDPAYRNEPSGSKKLLGWIRKERPSYRWWNWITWHIYETLSWIYDFQTDFYLVGTDGDYADINSAIADGVTRIALCSDIVIDTEQDISLDDVILKTNGYSIISDTDAITGAILKISGRDFSASGLIKVLSTNTTGNTTHGILVEADNALFRARISQTGAGTLDNGLTVDTAVEGSKIYAHFVEQGGTITTKLNDLSYAYTNIIEYIDVYSGAKVPDEVMYNVSKEITGTDIDWSLSRVWRKIIDDDTTFTFSNTNKNNKKIIVSITDSNNKDNTWPSYIKWDNDASAPSQTHLKTDVYEFRNIGGNIIGKRIYVNMTGSWPYGILGDLHVTTSNTPYNLPAGAIYDYNNLEIDSGCKLVFTGNTVNFTILGVKGNLINNGTIEAKNSTAVGSASATAPDGVALSSTITQKSGGAGGNSGSCYLYGTRAGASGQAQSNGEGGGGASGVAATRDDDGDISVSPAKAPSVNGSQGCSLNGSNGEPAPTTGYLSEVLGGTTKYCVTSRYNGANGSTLSNFYQLVYASSAGAGGGGSKGLHGKNLYIHVKGDITGSGTIDVSGNNGGNGGNAGGNSYARTATDWITAAGGSGGGGGGAGGSAGKLIIRYEGAYVSPLTYITTGGTGGTGGAKGNGAATGGASANNGVAGGSGTNGDTTVEDVASM